MSDDVVARLRLYAQKQRETESSVLALLLSDSADEIERIRAALSVIAENANDEPYSAEYAKDVLAGRVR